ncbi:hypothetical protein AP220_27505, partial [Escherichia coli]
ATINDIGGILGLNRPPGEQRIFVRRFREQVGVGIDKITHIQRGKTTICCAAPFSFPGKKVGEKGLGFLFFTTDAADEKRRGRIVGGGGI